MNAKKVAKEIVANKSSLKNIRKDMLVIYSLELAQAYLDLLAKQEGPKELTRGCIVMMKKESGIQGWGNAQCVKSVCEPLGEFGLFGHNQLYKIHHIKEILEYPSQIYQEGYKLVPLEPSEEMIKAMEWQIGGTKDNPVKTWGTVRAIYDAAIGVSDE